MLFACDTCGCIDNTELQSDASSATGQLSGNVILQCSLCKSGKWHNLFPRNQYRPGIDIVGNRPSSVGID